MADNGSISQVTPVDSKTHLMHIESLIYLVRGQQVMLDSDLARLYGVETRRLNEQVKRNAERFPEDFMFQLKKEEYDGLMSQFATSSRRSQFMTANEPLGNLKSQNATSSWGGTRKLPYVFNVSSTKIIRRVSVG